MSVNDWKDMMCMSFHRRRVNEMSVHVLTDRDGENTL